MKRPSRAGARHAPSSADPNSSGSDDEFLRLVLEGVAQTTGQSFFQALVRHLATAAPFAGAFVGELTPARDAVRLLAAWSAGRFLEPAEYELAGTPCEGVARGRLSHHPTGVRARFPRAGRLADWGAEGYLAVPLLDETGQVVGLLGMYDTGPLEAAPGRISVLRILAARASAELKSVRMQCALLDSERRFRDLFDEAPIGYVYEDTQTRFVSANRAAMQILGLRPEEVAGTVGLSLVAPTPEAQERVHDSLKAEQTGKEKPYIEIELRRKSDGRSVWIQRFSRPEPDGKHTRTMLVDITERVEAERDRVRLKQHNAYLREEIESEYNLDEIVGDSAGLRRVLTAVKQVARTDSTVLLTGETGTGKELIARALHSGSRRRERPLIKLNCGALPAGLIESELFGHEKGAFTGALEKRAGRFALAHGGTIFLDEIGDIPLDVQVRLLRVLQEQEFEPLGSTRTVRVDVRVISATNRDLAAAVRSGEFRADLFYRLNVFPIVVPPLRERREDIPLLALYFAAKHGARIGKRIDAIDEETMERLVGYAWPGNIRELENVIERALILSTGPTLVVDASALPEDAAGRPPRTPGSTPATLSLAAHERAHLSKVLEASGWRIEGPSGAACALGLNPSTLRSRMKKLGLERPR